MEESGQLHAPAALPPGKEPLVPTEHKTSLFSAAQNRNAKELMKLTKQRITITGSWKIILGI
jgi:hypothetical protein